MLGWQDNVNEKAYEEVGANYRFFLAWRHASFAGMLVVLFATAQLTLSTFKDQPRLAWLIPMLASPLGLLLWIIDIRTRALYHAAIRAGKRLEGEAGGFYTELSQVTLPPGASSFSQLSQSAALNILFLASFVALIILGLVLRRAVP